MLTRNKIIRLADRKMKAGEKKYGIWNPKTDKRKLRKEMVHYSKLIYERSLSSATDGNLSCKITVQLDAYSVSAKKAIQEAGGQIL